jgi:hypothetical protein
MIDGKAFAIVLQTTKFSDFAPHTVRAKLACVIVMNVPNVAGLFG